MSKDEKISWTEDQQRVIDARNKSLLVSAAAGSGKTAVLVARILSLITDPHDPADVDDILIVTFTEAAAAEMRERIRKSISDAARANPTDRHLQWQMSLIHNAQISTIDSFCLQVVRNHFQEISLEPGFRIGNSGELRLVSEDATDAVMEDFYAERDPAFLRFIEGYSDAKSDQKVRKKITDLYKYVQSYPYPDEWLDKCAGQYDVSSIEETEQKDWWESYVAYLRFSAEEIAALCRQNLATAKAGEGAENYIPALESDLEQAERLIGCRSIDEWKAALDGFEFMSLYSYIKGEGDPERQEKIKDVRNNKVKKKIKKLKKEFAAVLDGQVEILSKTGEMVAVLVKLTKAYSERLAQEKAKRNILDFPDVEHFALDILVDRESGEPTGVAREYRRKYREVMIDEYQDSNYLQEAILTAVSRIDEGTRNMFMVGDVKQSIYRFRRACPDLFIDKYDRFPTTDNPTQRIDLHKNFRSRKEIIGFVNDLFGRIMGRDIGNVEYDEDAALYQGRKCEDEDNPVWRPECIVVGVDNDEDKVKEDPAFIEAGVIARRIRKMVEEEEIPGIGYRDIVVLSRSLTSSRHFVKAFEQEGVPLLVNSRTGYFNAPEVQVVISMLRVIDNPRQDVPLAALMRSPIGGFTDEEMAGIRAEDTEAPFYECVLSSTGNEKLGRLLDMIGDFRERMSYTPIHILIRQIYDETGYRDIVSAMPAGEQRKANLDMLIEKAADYEQTSYHGLYHFVRYIDRLIKYEVEIGEAEISSEQENTVRLMTIHKSKGLEFPVVFVAGMGKQINLKDSNADMIFHPDYGIGIKYCDPERRTKSNTLIRNAFSFVEKREELGEELRVLYVAMTRAKDKLILVGRESKNDKECETDAGDSRKFSFVMRYGALTYWDWVLPALSVMGDDCDVHYEGEAEEEAEDALRLVRTAARKAALLEELETADGEEIIEDIAEKFSWEYPYRRSSLKQKMSVSEIKHRAMAEAAEMAGSADGQEIFPEETRTPYIPKFIKEPEENIGALRGTAFHRLMECLDFASLPDEPETWLEDEIGRICGSGRMEPEDARRIDRMQTLRFLKTDTAKRMAKAAQKGFLMREQPFVMSVLAEQLPADMALKEADKGESILIQGIIDAFWEEEDGIVLLDYKTDRVKDPGELIRRYRAQLILYAEALGRRFGGKRVKDTLIYSFCLDELIPVDTGEAAL